MPGAWENSRPGAFSPEEQASSDAYEASIREKNMVEVARALAGTRDPGARNVLLAEQQKIAGGPKVDQGAIFVEKETGNVFRQNEDGSFVYLGKVKDQPRNSGALTPAQGMAKDFSEGNFPGQMFGRALERGVKKAVTGLPGLVGDTAVNVGNWLERKFPLMEHEPRGGGSPGANMTPTSMMPSEALDQLAGVPQPRGGAEQVLGDVISGAMSGGMVGATSKMKNISQALAARSGAVSGASGALGSDAGDAALPHMGPVPGLVGGVAGAVLGGGPQLIGPRGTGRIREAASGISDSEFAQAKQNMADAASLPEPIKLTAAQALPAQSPLLTLQERLTQAPGAGVSMSKGLRAQGDSVEAAGQGLLDRIAPAAPPADTSFAAQSTAIKAREADKNFRTDETRDYFAFRVPKIDNQSVRGFRDQLVGLQNALGPTTPAGEFIGSNLISKLQLAPEKPGVPPTPGSPPLQIVSGARGQVGQALTPDLNEKPGLSPKAAKFEVNPEALNEILSGAKIKLAAPNVEDLGIKRRQAGQIRKAIDDFNTYLDRYRNDAQAGRDTFQQLSTDVVNPSERGLLGQITGSTKSLMDLERNPTEASRLTSLLTDTQNLNAGVIARDALKMNRQDPMAFPGLFRSTLERQASEVAAKGKGGWQSDQFPGDLAKAWWGASPSDPLRTNFMASIAAAAEGRILQNAPPSGMRVFHGTNSLGAATPDLSRAGSISGIKNEPAFWVTSSEDSARKFSDMAVQSGGGKGTSIPFDLRATKPVTVEYSPAEMQNLDSIKSSAIAKAKAAGNDAVIFKMTDVNKMFNIPDEIAVLDPKALSRPSGTVRANPRFIAEAQQGAENVMRAIEMAGRGRGGLGKAQESQSGTAGDVARGAAVAALGNTYQAPYIVGKAVSRFPGTDMALSKLLGAGTPESVDILRSMARRDPREILKAITWGAIPQIAVQADQQTPKEP